MIKKLYQFTLDKEELVDVTEETTNEKGEKVTTQKKEKKMVPHTFFLKKPNRIMQDEAELFHGSKLAECIKKGLMTRPLLSKRFANDGGVFTETEVQKVKDLYIEFFEKQNDLQKLLLKKEDERTDVEKESVKTLSGRVGEISVDLQQYEQLEDGLYNQTAEGIARNKVMLWWALHLSYETNDKEEEKELFGSGSYEDRVKRLEVMEDTDDAFYNRVVKRLMLTSSFWFSGRASKQEDFDDVVRMWKEKLEL